MFSSTYLVKTIGVSGSVHAVSKPVLHDSNACYPYPRQLSTRTNPSAFLAVNMLPIIGIRMLNGPLPTFPFSLPLPGVPITQRVTDPTPAFLNFRGASTESPDLWLVDGRRRGAVGRWEGRLQRGGRVCCCSLQRSLAYTYAQLFPLYASDSWGALSLVYIVLHAQNLALIWFSRSNVTGYLWSWPHSPSTKDCDFLWFSLSFFISKVTLQRVPPCFFYCTCIKYPSCS